MGDKLELRGPIGGYFVWEPDGRDPLQLVGGGSGVVPLMAMIRARVRSDSRQPVRLLYSARSLEDIIFRAELEAVAHRATGIEVTHALTRSQPQGWRGLSRRVDQDILAEFAWPPEISPLCFVCGPTGFVESASSALAALGHRPDRIRTERFGPTGGLG